MKLAVSVSGGRVATVLDFAHELLVVEFDRGREISRTQMKLLEAEHLTRFGINVLICGAISRSLAARLSGEAIEIVPFVSGPAEEVLASYRRGGLRDEDFLLPGCAPGARREWKARHPGRCYHGQPVREASS